MCIRDSPDIELLVKKLHENKGEWVGNYVKLNKEYSKAVSYTHLDVYKRQLTAI